MVNRALLEEQIHLSRELEGQIHFNAPITLHLLHDYVSYFQVYGQSSSAVLCLALSD